MKKIVMMLAVTLSASAYAQTGTGTQTQNQSTVTDSTSAATNAGNAQNITFNQQATVVPTSTTTHVEYSGDQTIKNVPSVSGPPLTTSNDTCMGSTSGSANGPGFGLSIGSTWTDPNCKLLKNSRELWNMGMKGAAMALMCKDKDNREALEMTGYACPSAKKQSQASNLVPSGPDMTDPLIAARVNASRN